MRARAAVLVAMLLLAGCSRRPDLSNGGTELVFAPRLAPGTKARERARMLGEIREKVSRRLSASKITALVATDGETLRVTVAAGIAPRTLARLKSLASAPARIEFRDVDDEGLLKLAPRAPASLRLVEETPGGPRSATLQAASREEAEGAVRTLAPHVPPGRALAIEPPDPAGAPWRVLLLGPVSVDNDGIGDAVASYGSGRAVVLASLREDATARFAALTRRLVGRRVAITLDGTIVAAPYVTGPIENGRVQITFGTQRPEHEQVDGAIDVALALQSRTPLPAPLDLVEERTLPPIR